MKKFVLTATALSMLIAPAHAQLLGNGSLTGGLGQAIDINSTISRTTDTVRTTTRGAIEGSAATNGDQSVESNSGRVEARRNAEANAAANLTQLATTPIGSMTGSASGSGNASESGEASAQLIGTDALRGSASSTVGAAQSATNPVIGQARDAVAMAPSMVPAAPAIPGGTVSSEGSASGEGLANLMSTPLAVAGSAAGSANGATSIAPGMMVVSPEGLPVGEVREIVANSQGQVEQVLISNGNAEQTIPAGNLTASGGALIFGQGKAEAETNPQEDEGEEA